MKGNLKGKRYRWNIPLSNWDQLKPFLLQNCIFVFLFLGQLIGDCVDDQFSISGGLSGGTPTICGTNTGYHSKSETILLTSPSTVAINELCIMLEKRGGPDINVFDVK